MPRTCTVCLHPQRQAVDQALVENQPLRNIAERFSLSLAALHRHKIAHLPATLAKARAAQEVVQADDLLAQVKALRNKALSILVQAERAGDLNIALRGVREARGCLELLARLEGELDTRPQVNILLTSDWLTVRAVLMAALGPFPEARQAVSGRLLLLEAGHDSR